MYAIIETGGKQYKVSEGDIIYIEKIENEARDEIKFDKILALSKEDDFVVGKPYVDGSFVDAKVVKQVKSKKIVVFKYKAKKNEKKKMGHRQSYTKVEIVKIGA